MTVNRKLWEENWIANKAGETVSLQMIWKQVLEPARPISTTQLNPLLRAIQKPSTAQRIFGAAIRCPEPEHVIEKLYEASSHYSASLEDWLDSIDIFMEWCQLKQKHPDLSASIDYITCCAEWLEQKPDSGSLQETTVDMLNKFGWDGDEQSCIY